MRSAVRRVGNYLGTRPAVKQLTAGVKNLADRSVPISDAELSRAMTHAPGVREAVAYSYDGKVSIELMYEDGSGFVASVIPTRCSFAPGGAKELHFMILPPHLAGSTSAADIVGVLAEEVASAIFGRFARSAEPGPLPPVDRDGEEYRVDLRATTALRALQATPAAMLFDLVSITRLRAARGCLWIDAGLPFANK